MNKTEFIKVRCTLEEKLRIKSKAESTGRKFSDYCREMLINGEVAAIPKMTDYEREAIAILQHTGRQKQHGSANLETKPTERRSEDEDYNPIKNRIGKVQKEEYLIKNACYSPAKYYLCKQNSKRSLLGRKQWSQVARSFPNRYQFSCNNKVAFLFSTSCILRIILHSNRWPVTA